jgi:hypothetical protein
MQLPQPLAVKYITFATGHRFDVTGIDQLDFKALRF